MSLTSYDWNMARGMSPNSHSVLDRATPAERTRSVLARALSAHVDWLDGRTPLDPGEVSGVILDSSEDGFGPHRPVVVEVADVAPLPVSDRVRARVRLHGHAQPAASRPGAIRLRVTAVTLEEGDLCTPVSPTELRAAKPDVVAANEGAFLCHLAQDHADLVRILIRLIDRETLDGARRVVPLAVDRHGLTMRVEYRRGHRDVLLAFAAPATTYDEVRCSLRDLALRAHGHCSQRIQAMLAAGPAAARLCAPDAPEESVQRDT